MNKQKICVIGDGISALLTSIVMAECGLSVDLISKDFYKKKNLRDH